MPSVKQYGWTTATAELTAAPVNDDVFTYTHNGNGLDATDRTLGSGESAVKYLGSYKTGGKSQASRNIKIVVPTGQSATISAIVSSNKAEATTFFIGSEISSTAPTEGNFVTSNATDNLQKLSQTLTAGTYYFNFTAAGRIYELLADVQ